MLDQSIEEILSVFSLAQGIKDGESLRTSEGLGWGSPDRTIKREGDCIRVYPGYGIISDCLFTIKKDGDCFRVYEGLGWLSSASYTIKREGNKLRVYEGLGIWGDCLRTISKE